MSDKTYYITCEYDTVIGPDNDEGDGSQYSGFSHEVRENHKFSVFNEDYKPNYLDKRYTTDLDPGFIIAVIYGDGGTFGRIDGYVQYIGLFSLEKATKIIELIKKIKTEPRYYGRNNYMNEFDYIKNELVMLINDRNFYPEWLGYFSSFEGMYIISTDGDYEKVSH